MLLSEIGHVHTRAHTPFHRKSDAINVQLYARAFNVDHELHWLFMGSIFHNYMRY